MYNYRFLLLFFLTFSCNLYPFSHDWTQQAIVVYKQCAEQLKICVADINVKEWFSATRDTEIQHFDYTYPSLEAKRFLKAFQQADTELERRLAIDSLANGALLGVLAACGGKLFKRERFDKKTVIAAVVAAAAWIGYQNNQFGVVPGYNGYNLAPVDNLFSNVSLTSFSRLVFMLASAGFSYATTRCVFDRLTSSDNEQKAISSIVAHDLED